VIGSTLGFGLALPLIAESNTVLTLSVALLFYGAMAGSMDVAMNTHAVMLQLDEMGVFRQMILYC
jgi:hypothetical protein